MAIDGTAAASIITPSKEESDASDLGCSDATAAAAASGLGMTILTLTVTLAALTVTRACIAAGTVVSKRLWKAVRLNDSTVPTIVKDVSTTGR